MCLNKYIIQDTYVNENILQKVYHIIYGIRMGVKIWGRRPVIC
jgi:hypothetical protein